MIITANKFNKIILCRRLCFIKISMNFRIIIIK